MFYMIFLGLSYQQGCLKVTYTVNIVFRFFFPHLYNFCDFHHGQLMGSVE